MSPPPDDARRPPGSGDDWDVPESSWLSDALPEGAWAAEPSDPVPLYQPVREPQPPPTPPVQPQPWQSGPAPYPTGPAPYQPASPQRPWAPEPPRRQRTGLVVGLSAGVVVVVGLVVAVVLLAGRGNGPGPVATDEQKTPTDPYEVTSLSRVESSVYGQLAKGDCFNGQPDLENALTTPAAVSVTPCDRQHDTQVLGFVDISDIDANQSDAALRAKYTDRCNDLMLAEHVPTGLQGAPTNFYYPNSHERDSGVGVVMCLTNASHPWTGSVLDGTAAGY